MDHERVLAAMDKELTAAQRKLDQLTTARHAYAQAHGLTGRKAVITRDGSPPGGSLTTAVLRAMQDGAWWHVDDVTAAVLRERTTTKNSVNATLARMVGDGGPVEHGQRKGMYRVRPEVLAGWGGRVPGAA